MRGGACVAYVHEFREKNFKAVIHLGRGAFVFGEFKSPLKVQYVTEVS